MFAWVYTASESSIGPMQRQQRRHQRQSNDRRPCNTNMTQSLAFLKLAASIISFKWLIRIIHTHQARLSTPQFFFSHMFQRKSVIRSPLKALLSFSHSLSAACQRSRIFVAWVGGFHTTNRAGYSIAGPRVLALVAAKSPVPRISVRYDKPAPLQDNCSSVSEPGDDPSSSDCGSARERH